jgi:hypothetical protein
MLAHTEHQADPIKAPVFHKLPYLVRISSFVAILLDPRAHPDTRASRTVMKFQYSPFLRVDQTVSNIEECPGQFPSSSTMLRVAIDERKMQNLRVLSTKSRQD